MHITAIEEKERTAQLVWTGFIILFFLVQAVIWTIAISFTARDQSHAVVANYDDQALKWDEVKSLRQSSSRLGWQSSIAIHPVADLRGFRDVAIKLTDKVGKPVENATVSIEVFHCGRAAEVQHLSFAETEPGTYRSRIQISRSGHWQFSGSATKQADVFVIETRQFVGTGGR